jgi:hypothetical protein
MAQIPICRCCRAKVIFRNTPIETIWSVRRQQVVGDDELFAPFERDGVVFGEGFPAERCACCGEDADDEAREYAGLFGAAIWVLGWRMVWGVVGVRVQAAEERLSVQDWR